MDNVHRSGLLSTQKGIEEFADYYRWEIATFEAKFSMKQRFAHDRSGIVVGDWKATHRDSGRKISMEMVVLFELDSSARIKSVSYYFDTAKLAEFLAEVSTASY